MATRTENEDNNVPLFQFKVSLKKKISIRVTHLAISQTATFLSIVQLYPGLYMNNRTWIKKIREQHQFISLVKVVICWLQECCKKEMCTVVQKLCQEAFHWAH